MSSTNLSSHTGRHNKQFFHSAAGNAKIYLKNYNIIPRLTLLMETFIHTYHHSLFFPSSSLTLFHFLENFLTSWTLLFWTLSFPQGPYFSSFSLGTVPYIYFTFLSSWVSNPPIQLGWSQDAPAWVCRPSSLQHLRFHPPGSTFWSRSRLLPITHAQLITSCPFNLSVGQSCLHFLSPLISNYPHQYPKS